jgi:hypothetical protein
MTDKIPTIEGARFATLAPLERGEKDLESTYADLHAFGDWIHDQVTVYDPRTETSRYAWAIHPQDATIVICQDTVTDECRAGPMPDQFDWLKDALPLAAERRKGMQ